MRDNVCFSKTFAGAFSKTKTSFLFNRLLMTDFYQYKYFLKSPLQLLYSPLMYLKENATLLLSPNVKSLFAGGSTLTF